MQFSSVKSFGTIAPFRAPKVVSQRRHMAVFAQKGQNRELWYPGAEAPAWLDGEYAGDYGFDPLGLAKDPERYAYFREAELYNGRWAMMGVLGMLVPDLLGISDFWNAGAKAGTGPFDLKTLIIVEILGVGFFEYFRYKAWKQKGTMSGVINQFPFDPLGLGKQADMQLKEVKNARLAMIAFFGFFFQYYIYGKGPIQNLTDHISDPWHNNIYTTRIGAEFTAFAIFFAALPTIFRAKQSIGKNSPEALQPAPFGLFLAPLLAVVLAIHVASGGTA